MGLQVRRRTKGKTSWQNFSYSKKGGARTSTSIQSGQVTYNTGNLLGKRKPRVTVNLGGGARYVWNPKSSSGSSKEEGGESLGIVWAVIIVVGLILVATFIYNFFWWILGSLIAGYLVVKLMSKDSSDGLQ